MLKRRTVPTWLRTGFYWFLAFEFFVGFATKFWPGETFFGPPYSEKFADWGFDPNMRYLVGAMELVCAILLLIPRRQSRFLGAAGLVLLLAGAVTTHVIDDAPVYEEVSAPLHLVIMLCVATVNWPAAPQELIRWRSAPTLHIQPSSAAPVRS
ncbi:DoxX family protein [Nocardia cyriacigeorgica]|uniref:DoxX family protein n=1 Tax=Nocardia cyriacigeorgica TaxID=135487 RepID=A0A6P1D1H0_9NOCA|nr:DoxX family protein [Nocardia cyriacigeorgica]NEW42202.1 DoxX family protein [Nocardia cyriacigeorgica]NEW44237.1 DoxX family protein [Nocardia cyriacigeorgica]NEW51266.1 DoxX family protein [Nocardia cyriacigeorgica]NEW56967.1 DoxX family protein [Nocardia cyriacigeorgica]